ncbi:peroxin [Puccinia graminis f. sp. tritici]|uniref:Peroxin n=1 Tax=Puccinia graminis f. sp. tritici TaxID=56615 RepID=A0A5B0Q120_PUCGR|nr:peroxin [Puccinia graminis f. sp. tritici]
MTIVASVFGGGYLAYHIYDRSWMRCRTHSHGRGPVRKRRFGSTKPDQSRSTTQIGQSPSNQEKEPSIKSTPPPEPESIPNGDHSSEPHPSLENSITTSSSPKIINPLDPTPTERAPSDETPASKPTTAPFPQDLARITRPTRRHGSPERSEIWREMIVVSFTRLFHVSIWVSPVDLTRHHVQLGLLGRDAYLAASSRSRSVMSREEELRDDEQVELWPEPVDSLDSPTERRYLTFSYWYLHQGWLVLARRTRIAVVDALASRNLKDFVSASDLLEIFDLVRKKVELEAGWISVQTIGDTSELKEFSSVILYYDLIG